MSGDPAATARQDTPPRFDPFSRCWIVTRHADAVAVLGNAATFSSHAAYAEGFAELGCPADLAERLHATIPIGTVQLVASDRPEHNRVRPVVTQLFTTTEIQSFAPLVRALAEDLAAELAVAGPIDLHARFAQPFSARAVLHALGFAPDRAAELAALTARASLLFFMQLDPPAKRRSGEALLTLEEETVALLRMRRAAARHDLASALISANTTARAPLSDAEMAQVLLDMAFAGSDPVLAVLSSFLLRMLAVEGGWQQAAAVPDKIGRVVEEAVRLANGLRGIARKSTCATVIGGVALPAGATVLVLPGPVNRDPATFTSPGDVCPGRANARAHIGFGYGVHYCVGAPFARIALAVALETLLARFPDLRLWPVQPVAFARSPMMTQVARLLVDPGAPRH